MKRCQKAAGSSPQFGIIIWSNAVSSISMVSQPLLLQLHIQLKQRCPRRLYTIGGMGGLTKPILLQHGCIQNWPLALGCTHIMQLQALWNVGSHSQSLQAAGCKAKKGSQSSPSQYFSSAIVFKPMPAHRKFGGAWCLCMRSAMLKRWLMNAGADEAALQNTMKLPKSSMEHRVKVDICRNTICRLRQSPNARLTVLGEITTQGLQKISKPPPDPCPLFNFKPFQLLNPLQAAKLWRARTVTIPA